jgi:rhodanese-related sulfurtransferase
MKMQTPSRSVNPTVLPPLLASGALLVDVREPIEHAEEFIEGSVLIPLGELPARMAELPKDRQLLVICRSGKRGQQAVAKLEAAGFSKARNVEGGILAWKAAGLPVTRSARKVFPLMRQVQIAIGIGILAGVLLSLTMDPRWIYLCAFFGAGLVFAGSTGWCGLAILISKMPWNRVSSGSCCSSTSSDL